MKKIWISILALSMSIAALGMGSVDDSQKLKLPEPDVNYEATIVDQDDVSLKLNKFSIDGRTYLMGQLGRADMSIDFNRIARMAFFIKNDDLKAQLTLKDGSRVVLTVQKDKSCYGQSAIAEVRITLKDVKTIAIHGRAAETQ